MTGRNRIGCLSKSPLLSSGHRAAIQCEAILCSFRAGPRFGQCRRRDTACDRAGSRREAASKRIRRRFGTWGGFRLRTNGSRLWCSGTPAWLLNGTLIDGAIPAHDFRRPVQQGAGREGLAHLCTSVCALRGPSRSTLKRVGSPVRKYAMTGLDGIDRHRRKR